MSATNTEAAGVGLTPAGAAAVALAAPPTGDPVASGRRVVPPPALNILNEHGAAAAPAAPAADLMGVRGLTPEQKRAMCEAARIDMSKCISTTDILSALKEQADVACLQCDQLRAQITTLSKQVAPAAPTAATLRLGGATKTGAAPPTLTPLQKAAVCKKLPELRAFAVGEDNVVNANYKGKIKPLVDDLASNGRPMVKGLRDSLKSFDPPGAFMGFLGRKAKKRGALAPVIGEISQTLGCPVPLTLDQAAGLQSRIAERAQTTAAAAGAYGAMAGNYAATVAARAREAEARAAELGRQAEAKRAANAAAARARAEAEAAAARAKAAANAEAARAKAAANAEAAKAAHEANIAARIAANAATMETVGRMENLAPPRGMTGGARRSRRSRKAHRKGRKARKTAKK